MNKMTLKIFAAVIVGILYISTYFITYLDGIERMNEAKRYVEIMTATTKSVDSRIGFVIEKVEATPEESGTLLRLFGLAQDDFEVSEEATSIPDTVTYPVKVEDTVWTLSIGYNYYLENISLDSIRSAGFVDYAILPTTEEDMLPRAEIRDTLDLGTENYVYQSETFLLGNHTTVKIVANIAKPVFYGIIYPKTVSDYLTLIMWCTGAYFVILILIFNVGTLTERSRHNNVIARTDKVTGLFNRKVLDEYSFRLGDALLLIALKDFKVEEGTDGQTTEEKLVLFSRALSDVARGNDIVIRLCGGEFAIILCKPSDRAYPSIIDRLRSITDLPFKHGKATHMLGMSKSDILNAADASLHKK